MYSNTGYNSVIYMNDECSYSSLGCKFSRMKMTIYNQKKKNICVVRNLTQIPTPQE